MRYISISLLAAFAVSGCATMSHPGQVEGAKAPKIVINNHKIPVWTNVGSFGPVQSADVQHAKTVCSSLDSDKTAYSPEGYHSRALQADGQPFPGGGYFCVGHRLK